MSGPDVKRLTLRDRGCTTNVEVLNGFVSIEGLSLLDIGCGGLTFTRLLVDQGAEVLGVDPDPIQAEKNRSVELPPGLTFEESSAEHLPVVSGVLDGVCFAYSLHHIPSEHHERVFEEVVRVLKPNGFLFVIEPTHCPQNEVMKLFHDEDRERELAWDALHRFAVPRFRAVQAVTYHSFASYRSWEDYAEQYASRSYNSTYNAADVYREEVKAAFERHVSDELTLRAEKRAMFLQSLK